MRLENYIDQIGDKKAAELFGVSHRTTQAWRRRYRRPMPDKAKEIEEKTNGLVKFEECY